MTQWIAQVGPQSYALSIPDTINEIFYGGQRGGGKTDTGITWMSEKAKNPHYRGLVIRKNADDLSDWIDRAQLMYLGMGADIAYRPWIIRFPSGAKIRTGHLKDSQAYTKYQGHEYHRILIEELTQIPDEKRYLMLKASNRSKYPELKPQMFLTANPGGVGHSWVKKRFIEIGPHYSVYTDEEGLKRVYIPAALEDNPALMTADPSYVKQLDALKRTDMDLWKAWRRGDWNIIAGQAFREWDETFHTVNRFDIPLNQCKRFIGFDWGYSAPGVALWIAITPENRYGVQRIYIYRELKLQYTDPKGWAKQLKMIRNIDGVKDMWLPHDCFNKESGDSIAEIFRREGGMNVRPAGTLKKGARHMRKAILHGILADANDGRPFLQVHENCKYFRESLPELIVDENDPEDIDTDGPDHSYDALTEALLMETPHFAQSSGIRQTDLPQLITPSPFSVLPDNSILGPDIMDAVKKSQTYAPRRPIER